MWRLCKHFFHVFKRTRKRGVVQAKTCDLAEITSDLCDWIWSDTLFYCRPFGYGLITFLYKFGFFKKISINSSKIYYYYQKSSIYLKNLIYWKTFHISSNLCDHAYSYLISINWRGIWITFKIFISLVAITRIVPLKKQKKTGIPCSLLILSFSYLLEPNIN